MYLSKFLGSSLLLPAHGWVGARATSLLAAHFALRNTASNSAEKKGSPSEGVAEGGGLGEEFRHARAEVRQQADKLRRFRRLSIKTSKQNNFQFLLRKIWRAGVKKLKENCFALLAEVRRAETRSGAIQAFFVQKRFELRSAIATNKRPSFRRAFYLSGWRDLNPRSHAPHACAIANFATARNLAKISLTYPAFLFKRQLAYLPGYVSI